MHRPRMASVFAAHDSRHKGDLGLTRTRHLAHLSTPVRLSQLDQKVVNLWHVDTVPNTANWGKTGPECSIDAGPKHQASTAL